MGIYEFSEKFSNTGFKTSMFLPAYGLAETTLMASAQRGLDTQILKEKTIVSCGQAVETLKIVQPETLVECSPGETGEIWLSGASVSMGYWNKPELSKETFEAQLANDKKKYLRTGDLGCVENEDLYVLGRIKEMMIFSGEKYFPQDIEATILTADEQLEDCAAFSISENGTEHLITIIKVPRHTDSMAHKAFATKIRKIVILHHQLPIKEIIFVTNSIPRTTSGKKQRVYCQQLYATYQLEKYFKFATTQEALYAATPN